MVGEHVEVQEKTVCKAPFWNDFFAIPENNFPFWNPKNVFFTYEFLI